MSHASQEPRAPVQDNTNPEELTALGGGGLGGGELTPLCQGCGANSGAEAGLGKVQQAAEGGAHRPAVPTPRGERGAGVGGECSLR